MRLKIKFLKWSAGLPVAMLNQKTAEEIGVHTKDRLSIKTLSKNPKSISTIIDTIENHLIKRNEIAVSSELRKILKLKNNQKVEVVLAPSSKSLDYIKNKLNGFHLTQDQTNEIIKDIVSNSLSEAEIAMFVSAMYEKGMNLEETIYLIKAIYKFGEHFTLKNKLVADKHSIGGIAGNRTSPIVVAVCAASGLIMPKTSSRAITSAAGTADVMEAICKVDFSIKDIKKIIQKTNACLVWGGGLGMVPADSKIIKIERTLGIDPEAQLLASIMSKKLAMGAKHILIDIPYGKTAKVTKPEALKLKKKFEYLGKHFKKNLRVVLTHGDEPMGSGVGPALELIDVIKILNPEEKGPKDLEEKSLFLSGQLLEMAKKAKKGAGMKMAREILDSGKAFEKFREIVKAQKGELKKISEIKPAKLKKDILVPESGKISEIHNKKINSLARVAGAPVSKLSGLYLYHDLHTNVKKGEKLLTIYSDSKSRLKEAVKFYKKEKPIKIKHILKKK